MKQQSCTFKNQYSKRQVPTKFLFWSIYISMSVTCFYAWWCAESCSVKVRYGDCCNSWTTFVNEATAVLLEYTIITPYTFLQRFNTRLGDVDFGVFTSYDAQDKAIWRYGTGMVVTLERWVIKTKLIAKYDL
jgi:hypothetical protein